MEQFLQSTLPYNYLLTFPLWEQTDEVLRMSSLDNAAINYTVIIIVIVHEESYEGKKLMLHQKIISPPIIRL